MSISAIEKETPKAEDVKITNDSLIVNLSDGRTTMSMVTPNNRFETDSLCRRSSFSLGALIFGRY